MCLLASLVVVLGPGRARAALPGEAPPLPPPDPGVYTIVNVSTMQELADACWNLESHEAIVVAPGTYDLTAHDFPNGVDGRLTVGRYGASPISDVQIRGATGDPADVVIVGGGMDDPTVPFGFQVFTATDVVIADLSVGSVYYHAVAVQGDQGAARVHLYHCRLFDAGEQIVKGNSGGGTVDDVIIELCEVYLTAGAIHHPELGYCYTNGIDAVGGRRWIVRDSVVRGITCQDGTLAGPAILMWQGSSDTLVERSTIVDCSRGVSLGLVASADHSGGIVRNNFIRWNPAAPYAVDAAVYTTSPGARILHNTILTHGLYRPGGTAVAVEVRFAGATGVTVQGNLMDGVVLPRDGAAPTVVDNLTSADPGWFADEADGDLHLLASASEAVDQVTSPSDCVDDFDGVIRPDGVGLADLGADELGRPLFADGFESGWTGAWSGTAP